jgi:uncharacterized protein involved in exopolysaccharide biosynthesis
MLYHNSSTTGYSQQLSENQAQNEFKYYFYYILFKRKWLIVNVFILGVIATGLGLYLSTPLYKATSKIWVRSNMSQEVILFNDLYSKAALSTRTIPANNIVEIATSHAIARNIVDKFNLDEKLKNKIENPEDFRQYFWSYLEKGKNSIKGLIKYPYEKYKEFVTGELPVNKEEDYILMAVNKFIQDMTEIVLIPESDIINLSVWAESPDEAEAIVKELTSQVIKKNSSMEQNTVKDGYAFAKKELNKSENGLGIAEKQVQDFKEKWQISEIEVQKEVKLSKQDMVEKELISITARLFSLEAKLVEAKKQLTLQKKSLSSLQAHRELLNDMVLYEIEISALQAEKRYYEKTEAQVKNELNTIIEKELDLKRLQREVRLKEKLF